MNDFLGEILVFLFLPWFATAGRVWSRSLLSSRSLGLDDIASFITLLLATSQFSVLIALDAGTGFRPSAEVTPHNMAIAIQLELIVDLLYVLATCSLKFALGFLYLRFLTVHWQRCIVYAIMILTSAYCFFFFFFILFQCGAPRNFVAPIMAGHCGDRKALLLATYFHGALNATADWTFAILPLFFLWGMNASRQTKWSIWFVLALGSCGSICTIIRIVWIHKMPHPSDNFLVPLRELFLVSAAEVSIGLVCVCLATYRPLLRRILGEHDVAPHPPRQFDANAVVVQPSSSALSDLSSQGSMSSTLKEDWGVQGSQVSKGVEMEVMSIC